MFVKSEFPLDSALVCDSDLKKLGGIFLGVFLYILIHEESVFVINGSTM